MEDGLARIYIACWGTACLIGLAIFLRDPRSFSLSHPDYRQFLFQPWKISTFVAATAGMTLIAPYTGDPTWDYWDALFMSVLTFVSAPWAVGTLYRSTKGAFSVSRTYVAVCLWLFSASWSYDLYLLVRDGHYPTTWAENLAASSILYVLAGLLWNLEWRPELGMTLGFLESEWPQRLCEVPFSKIAWIAVPIMLIVGLLILSFLVT